MSHTSYITDPRRPEADFEVTWQALPCDRIPDVLWIIDAEGQNVINDSRLYTHCVDSLIGSGQFYAALSGAL